MVIFNQILLFITQHSGTTDSSGEVTEKEILTPLLNFCQNQNYTSVYKILKEIPKTFTSCVYDPQRDWPDLLEIRLQHFRRQIGVILQNESQRFVHEIYTIKSLSEGYKHFVRPIYPTIEVPPLVEYLDRDAYPQHDEVRMQLMKWIISDKLVDIDLSEVTPNYFCSALTLFFMVDQGFITVREADIILLSIQHVTSDMVPENLEYPPVVDKRAFQISFLFSLKFKSIGYSIKQCGMKHLTSFLVYDGVMFHTFYLKFKGSEEDPAALLADYEHCRVYTSAAQKVPIETL
jgi:hypothetical protein